MRFHILVVSWGYLVHQYIGWNLTAGKKCATFILPWLTANPCTAKSAFPISILIKKNFDNSILCQNLYLSHSSSPMSCLIVKPSPGVVTIYPSGLDVKV